MIEFAACQTCASRGNTTGIHSTNISPCTLPFFSSVGSQQCGHTRIGTARACVLAGTYDGSRATAFLRKAPRARERNMESAMAAGKEGMEWNDRSCHSCVSCSSQRTEADKTRRTFARKSPSGAANLPSRRGAVWARLREWRRSGPCRKTTA